MTFSLSLFLYVYLVFLFLWFIFSLIGVFHIVKFSQFTFMSVFSLGAYVILSLVILGVSFMYIRQIDWTTQINLFSNFNSLNAGF